MLHFVTSYMKQNKSHKQTLESVQNGLEIIFNIKMVSGASIKFEVGSWLEKSNRLYTTYSYFKESFFNYLNLGGGEVAGFSGCSSQWFLSAVGAK